MHDLTIEERTQIEREEDLVLDAQFLLQDRMGELGISRADLARRANISKARVTQILQPGGNPTLHNLARLFGAMNIEITFVVKGSAAGMEAHREDGDDAVSLFTQALSRRIDKFDFDISFDPAATPYEGFAGTRMRRSDVRVDIGDETANDNVDYDRMAMAL